jgi:hypothetical protein
MLGCRLSEREERKNGLRQVPLVGVGLGRSVLRPYMIVLEARAIHSEGLRRG